MCFQESPPGNVLNEQPVKSEGGSKKSNRGSPFEEETDELKKSLHRDQESKSPKPPNKSIAEDEKTHTTFRYCLINLLICLMMGLSMSLF